MFEFIAAAASTWVVLLNDYYLGRFVWVIYVCRDFYAAYRGSLSDGEVDRVGEVNFVRVLCEYVDYGADYFKDRSITCILDVRSFMVDLVVFYEARWVVTVKEWV